MVKKLAPLVATLVFALIAPSLSAKDTPNIILIFADDLGWADIGANGNTFIDTPHIDSLASDGMRFTDFYAAGAVCSPTRCSVQSGQNQVRIGITAHIPGHWRPFERVIDPMTTMALPHETVTVAESLKKAGYTTGYVGKWHLGNNTTFHPSTHGYDWAQVVGGPHLPGTFRIQPNNKENIQPEKDEFRTDFEARLSDMFIQENKEKPFFLMLSPYQVHIPLGSKSELVDKYTKRAEERGTDLPHPVYAAMVEELDDLVGNVIKSVDAAGISDETLIVFTSDNGGLYKRYDYQEHADDIVTSNAPLRGEKGQLFDGGIRVPMIAKLPGVIPAGSTSAEVTISHDFYPTFVSMAGGELPVNQVIDGKDLSPILSQRAESVDRKAIYFHYPHYHHDRPASAIRKGPWKLIEYLDGTGERLLFNLQQDIGETKDLKEEYAGRLADLQKDLKVWRESVNARMPIHNPSYDPDRAAEWWNLRKGEPVDSAARKRFPATEKIREQMLKEESK